MRKIIYKAALLGVLSTFFIACSSDDETIIDDETNNPTNEVKYAHKVLIEDVTGTWCQYCPRVSYGIEQAMGNETYGKDVVAVAMHIGMSSYPDAMQIAGIGPLYQFFQSTGLTGFPYAMVNRADKWTAPEPNNLAQVFNSISKEGSPIGIKISSELTNTGGKISASFKFSKGYENLKYTIFVIENDVVTTQSPQQNSTSYYGGVRVDPNFVHQDVLRGFSGTITGNELGAVKLNDEVVKANQNVSYTLFNNDLSKVEVVVFVTDGNGEVLNVQKASANQSLDYEVM